ncbi:MAG TPA: helix-turn-helix transcriptional regulator [Jatrophihabitans sp.]|nr:helix-turn-helix transcriptional regulator [Jatrophihabitans sp.]
MAGAEGPHFSIVDFAEPVLLLSLADERILQASAAAADLLTGGVDPAGRTLPELAAGPGARAADLLRHGHLTGYLQRRRLSWVPAGSLEIRVRGLGPGAPALALLAVDGLPPSPSAEPVAAAVGWVDQQLGVRRIGGDAAPLLGPPEEALGRSLLELVCPEDLASVLFAIGQVALDGQPVSLSVGLRRGGPGSARYQLVLQPLAPAPSVAFALQPEGGPPAGAQDLPGLLRRFGDGLAAAAAARALATAQRRPERALPELTGREMQIVSRLLAGDRVPAIASQLYLAQSTVRNHLSAVFAKLGVSSQQELIVLLRTRQARPSE